jgi:cbb3-type cytochrome oxidase maturation protein
MTPLLFLVPIALTLGALGLLAFLWTLRNGQYDDLDGAAQRILIDNEIPEELHDQRPH